MNGGVWGLIVGLSALALYANVALGVVMSSAVVLNLVIAGLAGVAIPIVLHATGRDPAHGASVLLTFITDAMASSSSSASRASFSSSARPRRLE